MPHDARIDESAAHTRPNPALLAGLALAIGGLALHALWLSTTRPFALDEFTYAHAGWQMAQGQLPYRDFFAHHTPLLWQLLAPIAAATTTASGYLAAARWAAVAGWLLQLGLVWRLLRPRIGGRHGDAGWAGIYALLGPLALLAMPGWLDHAIELRPDGLALTLLLAALAAIDTTRRSEATTNIDRQRWRHVAAGILVVAGCWASPKVAIYGAALLPLWLIGATSAVWPRKRPAWLAAAGVGRPGAAVAGALAALALIAAWLVGNGLWLAFVQWVIRWPLTYEAGYAGFVWWLWLLPSLQGNEGLVLVALIGWATTLATLLRPGSLRPPATPPASATVTWTLLAMAPLALASAAVQSAAYPYSFLPLFACVGLFFALGARAMAEAARSQRPLIRGLVQLFIVVAIATGAARAFDHDLRPPPSKRVGQLAVLDDLEGLVAQNRAVFDSTGQAVRHPSPHFYGFTNPFVRAQGGDALGDALEAALRSSGCVAVLVDFATGSHAPAFERFLNAHYQPWDGDIWLWGERIADGTSNVWIPTDGIYLVVGARDAGPAVNPMRGHLIIDGAAVTDAHVALARGEHAVRWRPAQGRPAQGRAHVGPWLLWQPDDATTWSPRFALQPRLRHVL